MAVVCLALAAIFVFDTQVPAHFAGGMLYVLPLALGLWWPHPWYVWSIAGIASALTVADLLIRHPGDLVHPWFVITERVVVVAAIWFTAAVVNRWARVRRDFIAKSEDFERLIQSMAEAVLVVDAGGMVRRYNRAAVELLGRGAARLEGVHISEIIDAMGGARQDETVADQLLGQSERICFTGDGTRIPVIVSGARVHDPRNHANDDVVCVLLDVSGLRRAQRLAAAEQEWHRAIWETARDAIVTLGDTGTIETFSPSAVRMFGLSADAVVGQKLDLLIPELAETSLLECLNDCWEGKQRIESRRCCELTARNSSGDLFPVHLSLGEMFVNGRRTYCGFIRDLTESRATEEQLRRAQKMEAIGTLATGIAHDFNNLLMGVSGCASLALDSLDPSEAARMYLEEIKRSVDSGAAITRQLLAFGRKHEVAQVVFELNAVLAEQEKFLSRLLGEDIDVVLSLNASDSRVRADVSHVEQIVVNLVLNARDAMSSGGRLEIETGDRHLPESWGTGQLPSGDYVWLSVTDTGAGIAPEELSRVFEPFYTTKPPGQGTGLGLSTVFGIVTKAGGHVDITSELGKGTTVEILLPRARERITREIPVTDLAGLTDVHGTVLLVEDERLVRLAVQYYLDRAGYEVLVAADGEQAIQCCRNYSRQIDLLLTDIVLPGMRGDEVAREIRRMRPGIRVVCMSAHESGAPQDLFDAGGRARFLGKPFGEQELLCCVADSLGAGRSKRYLRSRSKPHSEVRGQLAAGTVYVVDDDSAIRLSLADALRRIGYTVREAADGCEAVETAARDEGPIAALIVDVVLPKLMGVAVAREIGAAHPEALVIFLSGYPREIALQEELVAADALFMPKPASAETLHLLITRHRAAAATPTGDCSGQAGSRRTCQSTVNLDR